MAVWERARLVSAFGRIGRGVFGLGLGDSAAPRKGKLLPDRPRLRLPVSGVGQRGGRPFIYFFFFEPGCPLVITCCLPCVASLLVTSGMRSSPPTAPPTWGARATWLGGRLSQVLGCHHMPLARPAIDRSIKETNLHEPDMVALCVTIRWAVCVKRGEQKVRVTKMEELLLVVRCVGLVRGTESLVYNPTGVYLVSIKY